MTVHRAEIRDGKQLPYRLGQFARHVVICSINGRSESRSKHLVKGLTVSRHVDSMRMICALQHHLEKTFGPWAGRATNAVSARSRRAKGCINVAT
jgi:hypothetical protein